VAVYAGFLDADETRTLSRECGTRRERGAFRPAGVGRSDEHRVAPAVRGDELAWIDPAAASPALRVYLERMEQLRLALNRRLFLGLFDYECHFSVYPPGASYARHLDRFRDDDRRTLSSVCYLNESWTAADGGALRLHSMPRDGHTDVLPVGGTLVTFLSERHEHEVLPARRLRTSIAGWFRTRP